MRASRELKKIDVKRLDVKTQEGSYVEGKHGRASLQAHNLYAASKQVAKLSKPSSSSMSQTQSQTSSTASVRGARMPTPARASSAGQLRQPPRTPLPMRSTFGTEHKRIGPRGEIAGIAYNFGKGSSREQARQASISKERQIEFHGRESSTFYKLPPSVGAKQPDGQKLDPPIWKFGTVPRDPRYNSGTAGGAEPQPGPESYEVRSAIGTAHPLTTVKSEPVFSFGKGSSREQARNASVTKERHSEFHGRHSPGPAQYRKESFTGGKLVLSRMATQPVYSMGGRTEFGLDTRGKDTPDKFYPTPGALGKQPESRYRQEPRAKIATVTRENSDKVFTGHELDVAKYGEEFGTFGKDSPGPTADYRTPGAFGKQVSSRYATRPRSAFLRSDRWHDYHRELKRNTVPGPGYYDV